MKVMSSLNLFCVILVIISATPNTDARKHQTIHQTYEGPRQVDILLTSLEREDWRDDEEPCKETIFKLLKEVKNQTLWATWIWDSMQLPVAGLYGSRHHLGSFDQCLADPWSQQPTQYCLVDVQLTAGGRPHEVLHPKSHVREFVEMKTKLGRRRINFNTLGVCLPAVRSPSSVARFSQHFHRLSHLPFRDVTVNPKYCQVKDSKTEYSTGFYIFWAVILITTAIAIMVNHVGESITNPILKEVADWFRPSKNFDALKKTNPEELLSLNGMRAFCMGTLVILHYYVNVFTLAIINPTDAEKSMNTTAGMFLVQMALILDAFFLLSGILHIKGLLAGHAGLLEVLWKRYLRIAIPLTLNLVFISSVLPHIVSGPLQPTLLVEQTEKCTRNWWQTLLMINNFVGSNEICPYIAWYLSCDFQLTILCSLIFWLTKEWRRGAIIRLCVLIYLLSVLVPAVWTYWKELPPILAYDLDEAAFHYRNRFFLSTYIKPYSRASPYLTGLGVGYIMHLYQPKYYRKTISQSWSILLGLFGFVIMFSVMGVGGSLSLSEYNALHISVYAAFDRSLFAIGLSLQLIVTEYGTFPLIGDFLSSKVFIPLSRLSYGVCLCHPILYWQNLYSTRVAMSYDFFHMLVNGFGYIVVSSVASFLLWFIVEGPVIKMSNSLFSKRIKKKSPINEVTENGVHQKTVKQS